MEKINNSHRKAISSNTDIDGSDPKGSEVINITSDNSCAEVPKRLKKSRKVLPKRIFSTLSWQTKAKISDKIAESLSKREVFQWSASPKKKPKFVAAVTLCAEGIGDPQPFAVKAEYRVRGERLPYWDELKRFLPFCGVALVGPTLIVGGPTKKETEKFAEYLNSSLLMELSEIVGEGWNKCTFGDLAVYTYVLPSLGAECCTEKKGYTLFPSLLPTKDEGRQINGQKGKPFPKKSHYDIAEEILHSAANGQPYSFNCLPQTKPKYVVEREWSGPFTERGHYSFVGAAANEHNELIAKHCGIYLRGRRLYVMDKSEAEAVRTMRLLIRAKEAFC